MDIRETTKTFALGTVGGFVKAGIATGVAVALTPVLGIPAAAGAAFAGTFFVTSQIVNVVGSTAIKAADIQKPVPKLLAQLGVGVVSFAAGLGAAAGVVTAVGLPITVSAGVNLIALTSLALFIVSFASVVIFGAVAITAIAIGLLVAYAVLKDRPDRQQALVTFLRENHMSKLADNIEINFAAAYAAA